jgi:hypothetical protein
MDKKYSFGGKKGKFKQMDKKKINDMSSFNPREKFAVKVWRRKEWRTRTRVRIDLEKVSESQNDRKNQSS